MRAITMDWDSITLTDCCIVYRFSGAAHIIERVQEDLGYGVALVNEILADFNEPGE
jgi:hypothetical protein